MKWSLDDLSPIMRLQAQAKLLAQSKGVRSHVLVTESTPGWTPEAKAKAKAGGAKRKRLKKK